MPKRADENQKTIVAALRKVGALCQDTHEVAHGYPDLVVCFRHRVFFLETKAKNGRLTPAQAAWHALWADAPVFIVRSVEDALDAIGAERYE